ncbi:GntR family transcriptional regulator [Paracandidimonas lactea]|uniref:GntR family transcriptional regulator n=1 Tax=Paracandidimonas lactea TaxID=2895524 RepID=UPI001F39B53A|nr:GntR family transcriptional regulator [Paracandidimonas lactea]
MSTHLPLPKYHHIYLLLKEQVEEGHYEDGLPGELDLTGQFRVARVTIRKALEQLAVEGIIERGRGKVTRPSPKYRKGHAARSIQNGSGFLTNVVTATRNTTVRVIECGYVCASHAVADALALSPNDQVKKIVRVRSISQGPRSFIITYLPPVLGEHIDADALRDHTVMGLLEKAGVQIGVVRQTLSARLADSIVAPLLEVSVGAALLTARRIVFDQNDRPVMLLYGQFRPDRYQYDMLLSGAQDGETIIWVAGAESVTQLEESSNSFPSTDKKP